MAKHKRKPAKGKPITTHQLFPAVVALWFGALFGLGSLAVRPSLLEGLVLKSHLDLVIPAAAPPLGVTARILVALVMAALGAVIGIVLARRIARPKPVATERKRSSRDLARGESAARPHYADASTRPPVNVSGDYGEEVASQGGGGALANRRRSLAIEHEEEAFVPHEMAPLPGGNPQVFDISELRMDEPQAAPAPAPEPAYAAFSEPQPAPAQPQPVALDWASAAPPSIPSEPVALPSAIEAQRQVFRAEVEPQQAEPLCPATQAAHDAGRQVFGISPAAPPSEVSRQVFGVTVADDDHAAQDLVKAAGYKTSVFEQEEPEPLFGQRPSADAGQTSIPPQVAAPAPVPQEFAATETALPAAQPVAAAPQPLVAETPLPEAPLPEAPLPEAPLPSPAGLGITDLASRLAESMRRRRAARSAAAAGEVPASAPAMPAPTLDPVEPAPIPQSYDPAPVPTPDLAAAPVPQAYEPPQEVAPVQVASAQFAAPDPVPAMAPTVSAGFDAPPAAPALPRAMQPLALDAFIEEDSALDPSLLPPRHIVMPAAPVSTAEAAIAAPAVTAPEPAPLELGEAEELPDDSANSEHYASLLELAPVRNPFVRIEEAEASGGDVEPVVIFPGQAPTPISAPQVAPFAAPVEPAPFRRFDAPTEAGQGHPVAVSAAPPAVEQGEAEQALRAALANLQRMSGAA